MAKHKGQSSPPFLFGVATAAHHIEGHNIHSDWWKHEQELTGGVSSGEACDSFRQFKRDRRLLEDLGCNSYRFSIEWSRLQPEAKIFDAAALHHYLQVIDDLRLHGIEPVVTLHHFTNPLWFEERGGWAREDSADIFLAYVKKLLPHLRGRVRYFTPINEPNIYVGNKYLGGIWHPYRRNPWVAWKALRHLAQAHKGSFALIKQTIPQSKVGSCVQSVDITPLPSLWWPLNAITAGLATFGISHLFYLLIGRQMDFVGLNFYSTYIVGLTSFPPLPRLIPLPITGGKLVMTSHPRRLLSALRAVCRYGKPIMITENGKLADDDTLRAQYLKDIFPILKEAIDEGIPLIGYQHFTHLDSFEWGFGFAPSFGLFAHHLKTHQVKPKASALVYRRLIEGFRRWQNNYV